MYLNAAGDVWFIANQVLQPRSERVRQGLRERRQQHPSTRLATCQRDGAMERDNSLSGACRPRDPRRPGVAAVDELTLRRMQKDRPSLPRKIERAFQFLDIRQHPEPALRV